MSLDHEQMTGNVSCEKVDKKSYIDYGYTLHHNSPPNKKIIAYTNNDVITEVLELTSQ
jgi:hypothetical protein